MHDLIIVHPTYPSMFWDLSHYIENWLNSIIFQNALKNYLPSRPCSTGKSNSLKSLWW